MIIAVRMLPVVLGAKGVSRLVIAFTKPVAMSRSNVATTASATMNATNGRTARGLNVSVKGRQLKTMASADSSTSAKTKSTNTAFTESENIESGIAGAGAAA